MDMGDIRISRGGIYSTSGTSFSCSLFLALSASGWWILTLGRRSRGLPPAAVVLWRDLDGEGSRARAAGVRSTLAFALVVLAPRAGRLRGPAKVELVLVWLSFLV